MTHLIFRIQGNNTRFMRLDNVFTRAYHVRIRLPRQLLRRQQKQETALQQADTEEPRHETQIRIVFKDVGDCFGGGDGVGHGCLEGRGGDPEIVVVEKVYGIPFSVYKNMEDVHYVGTVGGDDFGLDHRVRKAVGRCRVGSSGILAVRVVSVREVMSFELLDALTVGF